MRFFFTTALMSMTLGGVAFGLATKSSGFNAPPVSHDAKEEALLSAWIIRPTSQAWVTDCRVVSVHDGDTLTVEVTKRMNIRLLECWSPELKEEGGQEAKVALERMALGREALLSVPTHNKLGHSFSFGRTLGHLWIGEEKETVSQRLIQSGFATRHKVKKGR